MEAQLLRLRLVFEDRSLLNDAQRSEGMNRSWLLIEPHLHRKISDVCNHLLHIFNLRSSCPNGILLYMEGFVLPPSESTRILKDKEIICIKRKTMALGEAIEAEDAYNLLDEGEDNTREPVDNGMLLLANEEFDKETGGYKSESEDAEEEKLEDEPSPKEKASKKRKASVKLSSSKKKKHRSILMDGVKEEIATEDDNINIAERLPVKIKKSKTKEDNTSAETIIVKVKSPPKVKRKKKHLLSSAEDEVVKDETENVNDGESLPKKTSSKKKKIRANEETNNGIDETSDKKVKSSPNVKRSKQLQEHVNGFERDSTAPDEAKKGPSRSARRKKAKRKWRRELAKLSQNPDAHPEQEVSNEANVESKELDKVASKLVHKNTIKHEERNCNGNGNVDTKLVPCVVKPGHIRFEPLDEDEDVKQMEVPDVSFQWNGITSKKKGQKWGLEKCYATNQKDESQRASKESSMIRNANTQVPVVDLNDFDKLPLCTSPKEGDVIAYRLLELTSSWTPELSSFRVGKISHYDGNNIVLIPVPEYPIMFDNIDEDIPDNNNSLYLEDGSIEIKFSALVDVRSVKQSNSNATKAVSNGVNQTLHGDEKDAASNLMIFSSEKKENLSKTPSPVATKKEGDDNNNNTWDELKEALEAKKSELMEIDEEMKRDSGWNKWSYRALRGSALGPTMALLRSNNNI